MATFQGNADQLVSPLIFYRPYTRGDRRPTGQSDRRGDCRRNNCRDSRLVYTLQAIVAATIVPTVAAPY